MAWLVVVTQGERAMAFHDLRSFIARLERTGGLQRFREAVDPELESTALCLHALRQQGPALLMHQPCGSQHPLLGNLFGHRDRIEAAISGRPLASLRELGALLAAIKEPRWPSNQIGRATCRERVCKYVSISVVAGT